MQTKDIIDALGIKRERIQYYKKEIAFKKAYYQTAIKEGSEEAVKDWPCKEATLSLDRLPK